MTVQHALRDAVLSGLSFVAALGSAFFLTGVEDLPPDHRGCLGKRAVGGAPMEA